MNKKVVLIVGGLLLVCCLLTLCVMFVLPAVGVSLLENLNFSSSSTVTVGDYEQINVSRDPAADETRYESDDLGYSLILPSDWDVTETSSSAAEFSDPEGSSSINFEAFEDPAFSLITDINQEFCDSFGEGFRSGLQLGADEQDKFQFELFSLNGNVGCRSEGSIFEGITQRYYVFFNDANSKVYSIFYTASDDGSDKEAGEIMNTFSF
ncbi:MAG: hypothetical protein TR69_WS6001000276 [candidate division WS6 bacterium OLB20]|uniref:PsbP C-terminal domain-containing protein n=1 Tax=candidate division WS6 bacterium OLB20 TaxID=1617426 RepID=A0A136M0G8_9BACT|nr:MAG: hypothetical protein TR69_WS6001000276 [candidate division WS6 bacterium OLB20]